MTVPTSKRPRKRARLTRAASLVILELFAKKPSTVYEIARKLGMSSTGVRDWAHMLHARKEIPCIHIAGYALASKNGHRAIVYKWGPGEDAPRPRPKTCLERWQKSKAKKEQRTLEVVWPLSTRRDDDASQRS